MTQREFLRMWWHLRPRTIRRRSWCDLGLALHDFGADLTFPFRDPRMWWFCRRVQLHFRFGFPMPRTDTQKGIFRA